jgi:hypothetical protein
LKKEFPPYMIVSNYISALDIYARVKATYRSLFDFEEIIRENKSISWKDIVELIDTLSKKIDGMVKKLVNKIGEPALVRQALTTTKMYGLAKSILRSKMKFGVRIYKGYGFKEYRVRQFIYVAIKSMYYKYQYMLEELQRINC